MNGYPTTVLELENRFNSEKNCRECLIKPRRSEGFCCQRCGHDSTWTRADGIYECHRYGLQTLVIAGAICQGAKKPLRLALTFATRRPSDPFSPIRSCRRLVLLLVSTIMNTICSRTGDFYPISSRACRAYTTTKDIHYGLPGQYLGIAMPFQLLYRLMPLNFVNEARGLKKRI